MRHAISLQFTVTTHFQQRVKGPCAAYISFPSMIGGDAESRKLDMVPLGKSSSIRR
jgi:hypothetical protein